jgi:hypothetical protein
MPNVKLRPVVLALALFVGSVSVLTPLLGGCGFSREAALVHFTFPEEFEVTQGSAVLKGSTHASFYLEPGMHIVRFARDGKPYAAVVQIADGGEIYAHLDELDLRPIKFLQESR